MKWRTIFLALIPAIVFTMTADVLPDQPARGSWNLGFGGMFPRYDRVNVGIGNNDYGAYLELRKNFPDHIGLRARGGYSHLTGTWETSSPRDEKTDLLYMDLEVLYYLLPCESISPYLFAGFGPYYRKSTNLMPPVDSTSLDLQAGFGGGVEWKLTASLGLTTEFDYHITPNSRLDGVVNPAETNRQDTYWELALGLNIHFGSGCSSCCKEPPPPPVRAGMDSAEIEAIMKRHIPQEVTKEVIKEVVVEKKVPAEEAPDNLVIVGVSFVLNKAELLPESYPVLDDIARIFAEHRQIRVEIQGYADSSGNDAYNDSLSLKRAQAVKSYLVSKGIADKRLTTIGFGRRNPIVSDLTEEGRRINRRVEFRIVK